jgi:hypothetical protein
MSPDIHSLLSGVGPLSSLIPFSFSQATPSIHLPSTCILFLNQFPLFALPSPRALPSSTLLSSPLLSFALLSIGPPCWEAWACMHFVCSGAERSRMSKARQKATPALHGQRPQGSKLQRRHVRTLASMHATTYCKIRAASKLRFIRPGWAATSNLYLQNQKKQGLTSLHRIAGGRNGRVAFGPI